jgi:hypothetical protein
MEQTPENSKVACSSNSIIPEIFQLSQSAESKKLFGSISILQMYPKSTPKSIGGKQDFCSLSDTLERVGVRFKELSTLIEMLPIIFPSAPYWAIAKHY